LIRMTDNNKKGKNDREHLLRWITSIVLAPVLILVVGFASKVWLLLLVLLATGIGSWEFSRITYDEKKSKFPVDIFILLALTIPMLAYYYGLRGLLGGMLINIFACFSEAITFYGKREGVLEKLAFRIFHLIYIPYCLAHIVLLGRIWIFFVLAVIFAGDCGAYYVGKKFGRRKLCPDVSPGKTVEGAVGGFCSSLVMAIIFGIALSTDKNLLQLVIMALILNIIGQLGDLAESLIKRSHGLKDSSNILPGHGGLLDRLDSLLFAFPALYYML